MIVKKSLNKRPGRKNSGVGAWEVAVGAGLMIVVVGLAVDITVLNYAFTINDQACRDAARWGANTSYLNEAAVSAASQPNGTPNLVDAAKTALAMHHTDGTFISQPALVDETTNNIDYYNNGPTYGVAGADPPNPATNYKAVGISMVMVTSYVDCLLPMPLLWFGNNMSSDVTSGGTSKFRFKRRYFYPVVAQQFGP